MMLHVFYVMYAIAPPNTQRHIGVKESKELQPDLIESQNVRNKIRKNQIKQKAQAAACFKHVPKIAEIKRRNGITCFVNKQQEMKNKETFMYVARKRIKKKNN